MTDAAAATETRPDHTAFWADPTRASIRVSGTGGFRRYIVDPTGWANAFRDREDAEFESFEIARLNRDSDWTNR